MISASVVILTAGYILWTMQRVYLGPEYKGPHGDHLHADDRAANWRSPRRCWRLAILFGVYPQAIFNYMTPSVDRTVDQLTDWTEHVKTPTLQATVGPEAQPAAAVARQ